MELLKKGSKGDSVKLLQELLNKHGFNLTVDGDFGNKTEEAVKQFQRRLNLTVDGIVGSKTFEALQAKYEANINIIKDFLKVHITPKARTSIKYLVIHFTAGSSSKPGCAKSAKNTFETRQASADFCVDDRDIVQFNPDPYKYYCWAVGKSKTDITNSNSISIEICSNIKPGRSVKYANTDGWYFTKETLENTKKLAKYLMKKYNIPKNRVVRHWDVNHKNCPGIIGWNTGSLYDDNGKKIGQNNESEWLKFKNSL